MKWLLSILLIVNLGLWLGSSLHEAPAGAKSPLHAPLMADKIKMLTPEEVEALPKTGEVEGTPKPEEIYACYEWGSFSAHDLKEAQQVLGQQSVTATLEQKSTGEDARYWVFIPPLPTFQAALEKVVELKALGVEISFIIQEPPLRNAISLGVFKDERLATKLLEQLKRRGVVTAQKGVRNQEKGRSSLIINNMSADMAIELSKMGARFPGSELKQINCQ